MQLLLDIAPSSPPTLDNFVAGRNAELLQTLGNILAGQERERFIYLWGGSGCGKSHLLQAAVGASAKKELTTEFVACSGGGRRRSP